jgi:deoxyribodipyrimidine photolyase-related protein
MEKAGCPPNCPIFMREDHALATNVRHHQQKLVLFFASMRHFAQHCENDLHRTVVYQAEAHNPTCTYSQALADYCQIHQIERLFAYEPADFDAKQLIESIGLPITWVPNPMFLTSKNDWNNYRQSKKRLLMGDFYQVQRKRLRILTDPEGHPIGGQWSFDENNRKPLPKNVLPPPITTPDRTEITREVISYVAQHFSSHPGKASDFNYPVTHPQALAWLSEFLTERLSLFGDYEDAIPHRERTLFHSLLTPMLNIGLLTPQEVITQALKFEATAPINSLEGFIRQIIGWREFIYWMNAEYRQHHITPAQLPNHLNHHRKLKPCWWNGTTGLPPVDLVIQRTQQYAYAHHIERLMVVGATMLMCEVDPAESYRWFMENFIDSADWVMLPNVIGMSQFADGGIFATKPYISGSAYILKMSDHKKGDWYEIWDALYWNFIHKNEPLFATNQRMSMMLHALAKMPPAKREHHISTAANFIRRVTECPASPSQ